MTVEQAYQVAMVHRQAGRLGDAEALLRQILAVRPDYVDAWHQLGLVVLTLRRPGEAVEFLSRAIHLNPGVAAFYSDQGVAYWHLGRPAEAMASFQRTLQLAPNTSQAHRNLGDVLFALGQWDESIASYQRALAIAPHEASTHNNLGNVYLRQDRLAEAAACYRRATEIDPQLLQAQSNLGDVLTKLGRPDEGLACSRKVVALQPDFPDGHLNMGVALWSSELLDEAEACYRRAIGYRADFADAHLNLGVLLLLTGRYEEGWREYEWRWRSSSHETRLRGFSAPLWNGQPIPGKTILVHAEQGLGDTLQFLRFLPLGQERAQAEKVVFECQPLLVSLLRSSGDARTTIVARGDWDQGLPPFEVQIPLLNLPPVLQQFAPLPMSAPYLQADATRRSVWRTRLNPDAKIRIGLAWAGNPAHPNDRHRSVPPDVLLPLLALPGVSFVSLQIEPRGPLPPTFTAAGVLDYTRDITDFADTAALIAELDLVITVDTATAHLAGALGQPVWVMLPFIPDWRWGLGREDTPWYSAMHLFRQTKLGDWGGVVGRVAEALRERFWERFGAVKS